VTDFGELGIPLPPLSSVICLSKEDGRGERKEKVSSFLRVLIPKANQRILPASLPRRGSKLILSMHEASGAGDRGRFRRRQGGGRGRRRK